MLPTNQYNVFTTTEKEQNILENYFFYFEYHFSGQTLTGIIIYVVHSRVSLFPFLCSSDTYIHEREFVSYNNLR